MVKLKLIYASLAIIISSIYVIILLNVKLVLYRYRPLSHSIDSASLMLYPAI